MFQSTSVPYIFVHRELRISYRAVGEATICTRVIAQHSRSTNEL